MSLLTEHKNDWNAKRSFRSVSLERRNTHKMSLVGGQRCPVKKIVSHYRWTKSAKLSAFLPLQTALNGIFNRTQRFLGKMGTLTQIIQQANILFSFWTTTFAKITIPTPPTRVGFAVRVFTRWYNIQSTHIRTKRVPSMLLDGLLRKQLFRSLNETCKTTSAMNPKTLSYWNTCENTQTVWIINWGRSHELLHRWSSSWHYESRWSIR